MESKPRKKCPHNKEKYRCRECKGGAFCEHNKEKYQCRECKGGAFCEHNKLKYQCRDCKGNAFCEHNNLKSQCRDCNGSSFCEHNKRKCRCRDCNGREFCEHDKIKHSCRICNLNIVLINLQRRSLHRILHQSDLSKTKSTIEYLGCSPEYFKEYLQKKMTDDMTFETIHIDHIKPVSRFNLDDPDEFLDCCHYTNLQPLLGVTNLEKSNKWTEENDLFWHNNIKGKEYMSIYL